MTAWASIDPSGPHLAVGCSQAENHLCAQVPGMNYGRKDRIWRAPLSWPAWVAFCTVWSVQPVQVMPALQQWAAEQQADVQHAYELRRRLDAPADMAELIGRLEDRESHGTLYVPQRGGAAWLASRERAVLADPPGTGKTPQLIRALQAVQEMNGDALPALVICPGAALWSWAAELAAWAPELSTRVVSGTALARRRALEDGERADVYLTAWPNVRLHTRLARYPSQEFVRCDEHGGSTGKTAAWCEVHEKELDALGLRTVIADEAHRMKDAKSKQSRAVTWLAWQARYFWAATGTPVGDTVADIWPLARAIDPPGFPSRSRYLDLYAEKQFAWHGGTEILGIRPDHEAGFHATVQPLIRRIPMEAAASYMPEVLPPVTRHPEMSPAHRKVYAQAERELLADLPDGHTTVPANSGVLFARLCQLASSMIETADAEDPAGFTAEKIRRVLPSHKVDDLAEFLADEPGQLVVACYSPDLITLAERRLHQEKIATAKITGRMSAEDQHQAARFFQDGQARVIFITAAGAEAITLTAASTMFFLEPEPSYLRHVQKIGRVRRAGQRFPVRAVYCITPGTVDERLHELGQEKQERAGQVTQDAALMRWIVAGTELSDPAGTVAA